MDLSYNGNATPPNSAWLISWKQTSFKWQDFLPRCPQQTVNGRYSYWAHFTLSFFPTLFERQRQAEMQQAERSSIYWFSAKMPHQLGLDQAKTRSLTLHPVLPHEWQGASFTASEGVHDQEAELEVKSWRLKPNILMWHSDTPSSN